MATGGGSPKKPILASLKERLGVGPVDEASKHTTAQSARELALREELTALDKELSTVKSNVDALKEENDWLREEVQRTKRDTHEYVNYLTKKNSKRQSVISALSEKNQKELEYVMSERDRLVRHYEDTKAVLRQNILSLESEITQRTNELEGLQEYKAKQKAQKMEIWRLEKIIYDMKREHTEALEKMKAQYLEEKVRSQKVADSRVSSMEQKARKEALDCLASETKRISEENKALRAELVALIQKTRQQQQYKESLESQHKELLRDRELTHDIGKIRIRRAKVETKKKRPDTSTSSIADSIT